MLDFIFSISEETKYILIGILGIINIIVGYKDVKLICEMIRGWRYDAKDKNKIHFN